MMVKKVLTYLLLVAFIFTSMPMPWAMPAFAEAPAPAKTSTALVQTVNDFKDVRALTEQTEAAVIKAFAASGSYDVLPLDKVNKAINDLGFKEPLDFVQCQSVAKALNLKTFLIAKVADYKLVPDPKTITTELVINVVDTQTGLIISKTQASGVANAATLKNNDSDYMNEYALDEATQVGVHEIITNFDTKGVVTSVADPTQEVEVSINQSSGLNPEAEIIISRGDRYIAQGKAIKVGGTTSVVKVTDRAPGTNIAQGDRAFTSFNPSPERLIKILEASKQSVPTSVNTAAGRGVGAAVAKGGASSMLAILGVLALAAIGKTGGDQAAVLTDEYFNLGSTPESVINGVATYVLSGSIRDAHNNPVGSKTVKLSISPYGITANGTASTYFYSADGKIEDNGNPVKVRIKYADFVNNNFAYPTVTLDSEGVIGKLSLVPLDNWYVPVISLVKPQAGDNAGVVNHYITITGENFGDAGTNLPPTGFGVYTNGTIINTGTAGNYTTWNDTRIVVKLDAANAAVLTNPTAIEVRNNTTVTTQYGPMVIQNSSALLSPNIITDLAMQPSITAMTPTTGGTGTLVTLDGNFFGGVMGSSKVSFLGSGTPGDEVDCLPSDIQSWADTQIVLNVPAGSISGPVVVTVNGVESNQDFLFTVTASMLSFTPTTGTAGTAVTVTGLFASPQATNNIYFSNGTTLNVPAPTPAVSWNSTQVVVLVPAGAKTGKLGYGNAAPPTVISTADFIVPGPAITTVTPQAGDTGGVINHKVTITGTGFGVNDGVTPPAGFSVAGFGTPTAPAYSVWNDTSIVLTIPNNTDINNPAPVQIIAPAGSSAVYSLAMQPSVVSVTPSNGSTGLYPVTITGLFFGTVQGSSTVTFGGVDAGTVNIGDWSNTELVVTVPGGAASGPVVVTVNGIASNNDILFTVNQSILSFTPLTGSNGTLVTIQGIGFTAGTTFQFGASPTAAVPINWTATQAVVQVPPDATTGYISIPTTTVQSLDTYTVPIPNITAIVPESGDSGGVIGHDITITGTGFGINDGATAPAGWTVAGITPGTFTVWNDTQIVVSIAAAPANNPALIQVTAPAGVGNSNMFALTMQPSIVTLTPTTGATGDLVTIDGGFFGATQGSSTVTFGGVDCGTLAIANWTDTQIVASVPAGAVSGPVVVTVNGVASNADQLFTVTNGIATFTPGFGPAGTLVTVTGVGFGAAQGANNFFFSDGTVAANLPAPTPAVFWSDTRSIIIVPSGATTGVIGFGAAAPATVLSSGAFTVPSPIVTGVQVQAGDTGGVVNHMVTISGANFGSVQSAVANAVTLNGANIPAANINSWSDTQIIIVLPLAAESGLVKVATGNGVDPYISNGITLTMRPSVTAVTPSDAYSGQAITIDGKYFDAVTGDDVQGSSTVTIGGVDAGQATTWTDTQIIINVPANAISGPIVVTVSGIASNNDVMITIRGAITGVAPASGSTGTLVTISGIGFTGVTVADILFGNPTAPINPVAIESQTDTQVVVKVPPDAVSGFITMNLAGGTQLVTSPAVFNVPVPSINGITLPAGDTGGVIGHQVTISGSNFGAEQGSSVVTFYNGAVAATYAGWSDTSIIVTIPDDPGLASGLVTVTTGGNTAPYMSNGYNLTMQPSITAVTPNAGATGDLVTLAGNFFGALQGNSTVTVGGVAVTELGPGGWTATAIEIVVPPAAVSGPVIVTVGGIASNNDILFDVNTSILSFTPATGSAGTQVIITGTGLAAGAVTFGGVAATPTSQTNTQIIVPVPPDAVSGKIAVGGTVVSATDFVVPKATITTLVPQSGDAAGVSGHRLTINGSGFGVNDGVTPPAGWDVQFDGGTGSLTVISWVDTVIIGTIPDNFTVNPVNVQVLSAAADPSYSSNIVPLAMQPSITTVVPDSGATGSTVTLTGNFFGATQGASTITFNGVAATVLGAGGWSDTVIEVVVPPAATSGPVIVTVNGIASNNDKLFGVTGSITSFTPNSGPTGTQVTVNGVGFTAGAIDINGVAVAGTDIISQTDTQAVIKVPADATTGLITIGAAVSATVFTVPEPVLTQLSSTTGFVGEIVTLNGNNFGATQGASTVTFGGTPVGTYQSWTNSTIVVEVPVGAVSGDVLVNLAAGTSNALYFGLRPSITAIETTSHPGEAIGVTGETATITGENFGATQTNSVVTFSGVQATVTLWTPTSIEATVPNGAMTGPVVVTLFDAQGTPNSSNNWQFTVTGSITGVNPNSGPTGTLITIQGVGLAAGAVTIDGIAAVVISQTDSQIVAQVPDDATSGIVMVGALEAAQPFTVPVPEIMSLSANDGFVNQPITINGSNFGATQGTSTVTFGGTPVATYQGWSNNNIVALVPAGAVSGDVIVTLAAGASNGVYFTLRPSITGITPPSGGSGALVDIAGENFGATQGTSTISFNGMPASLDPTTGTWSATLLNDVVVPAGATTGPVIVTLYDNEGHPVSSNSFQFTVTGSITAFTPDNGPGGTLVTIQGVGLGTGAIDINGVAVAGTDIISQTDNQVVIKVPADATTGYITIGTIQSAQVFTVPEPVLATLSALSGFEGMEITLSGANFGATQGTNTVSFNGTPVTDYLSWTDTAIVVKVPAGATTGDVTVATGGGTLVSNSRYFILRPSITGIVTDSHPADAIGVTGETATISGANFGASQTNSRITFNGVEAVATLWTANSIEATVPNGAASGPVVVTLYDLDSNPIASNSWQFTVSSAIIGFTPATGAVGSFVTITGTGFGNAPPTAPNGIYIADIAAGATTPAHLATVFAGWTDTQVIAQVPDTLAAGTSAIFGPIKYKFGAGATDFVASATDYLIAAPTVAAVTPASGSELDTVTVTGTNFGLTQGSSTVSFGATAVTSYITWGDSAIVVQVPAGAATVSNVIVTTPGGEVTGPTFTLLPTITDIQSPLATPITQAYGGQTVFIIGTNFGDASSPGAKTVTFNGVAGNVLAWSDSQIQVQVPVNASSGDVVVTNNGIASTARFLTISLSVSSFSPTSGVVGTPLTILGSGFGAAGGTSEVRFTAGATTVTVLSTAPNVGWSNTMITLLIPDTIAGRYNTVAVYNGTNAVTATGQLSINAPAITLINGTTTPSGVPGNTVTITGSNFGASQGTLGAVDFNGTSATIISWSNAQIFATVPVSTSGPVTVTTAGGDSNVIYFAYSPYITAINPTNGVSGDAVTIDGSNFGDNPANGQISFNGAIVPNDSTNITQWLDTQIICLVPAAATTGNLTVTVNNITSNGLNFNVNAAISTVAPLTGVSGDRITVTGFGFGAATGTVEVGGVALTDVVWSETSITANLPANVVSGDIVVTTAAPYTLTAPQPFTVLSPVITSISPDTDQAGSILTVIGTNFGNLQFNTTPALQWELLGSGLPQSMVAGIQQWTNTRVVVRLSAPAPDTSGAYRIILTTGGGSTGQAGPLFFYLAGRPTFTFLEANGYQVNANDNDASLVVRYGDEIIIRGTNFGQPSLPLTDARYKVQVNETDVVDYISWTNNEIRILLPSAAPTYGHIRVITPATSGTFEETHAGYAVLQIASIVPESAPLNTTVTLTGTGFGVQPGGSQVEFSQDSFGTSTVASIYSWNPTQIVAYVPATLTAGMADIRVSLQEATLWITSNTHRIYVIGPPYIASISGAPGGNITRLTPVTIIGTGFGPAATGYVSFLGVGGLAVDVTGTDVRVTSWSDSQIIVRVPALAASGLGNVTVTQTGGTAPGTSNQRAITVLDPTVSALSPSAASRDVEITLSGYGFGELTDITPANSFVVFNGASTTQIAASAVNEWTNNKIRVCIPGNAITGNVRVLVQYADPSTADTLDVSSNNTTLTLNPVNIASMLPASAYRGERVTITGTGFGTLFATGTYAVYYNVGGVPTSRTRAQIIADGGSWNDSQIVFVVPFNATSGNVYVQVLYDTLPSNVTYTSNVELLTISRPTVTSITPASNYRGYVVTLVGGGFGETQGAGYVSFSGSPTNAVIVSWNNTQIECVVPPDIAALTTNSQVVVTPDPAVSSVPSLAYAFTVLDPVLTGIEPVSGPRGSFVTLTGTGFGTTQISASQTGTVWFGTDQATEFTFWSSSSIIVKVPTTLANIPAALNITVQISYTGGVNVVTDPLSFLVTDPVITSLTPVPVYPAHYLTITGNGFGDVGDIVQANSYVRFNTSPLTDYAANSPEVALWTNTQIVVRVPNIVEPSTHTVMVHTEYPSAIFVETIETSYTVGSPTITGITSTVYYLDNVTLTGVGFGNQADLDLVNTTLNLGGPISDPRLVTDCSVWNDTQIVCTVHTDVATPDVYVSVRYSGSAYDYLSAHTSFIVASPTITAVAPAAPIYRGDYITLTGNGFGPSSYTVDASFFAAGVVGTNHTNTQAIVQVPPDAITGPLLLTVNDPVGGVNPTTNSVAFTIAAPVLSTIGSAAQTEQVNITGAGFGTGYVGGSTGTAEFTASGGGTTSAPLTILTDTTASVTVPANAVTGPVYLTIDYQSSGNVYTTNSLVFTLAQPAVSLVSPNTVGLNELVTLTGSNFGVNTGSVDIGGQVQPILAWTSTQIIFKVDEGTACPSGGLQLTVTNASGATAPLVAINIIPPIITSVTPVTFTQGQLVTIVGNHFGEPYPSNIGTDAVQLTDTAATIELQAPTSWSNTQIIFPVSATTLTAGNVFATVTDPAGNAVNSALYTLGPSITGITPVVVDDVAGFSFTIDGNGFGAVQGTGTVDNQTDGRSLLGITSWTNSKIVLTYAAIGWTDEGNSLGNITIGVTVNGIGSSNTANLTVGRQPVLTAIGSTPSSPSDIAGFTLTLGGTGFNLADQVWDATGGIQCNPAITWTSTSCILDYSSASSWTGEGHATGVPVSIYVMTPAGVMSNTVNFTVSTGVVPNITNITTTPAAPSDLAGFSVTITGTGFGTVNSITDATAAIAFPWFRVSSQSATQIILDYTGANSWTGDGHATAVPTSIYMTTADGANSNWFNITVSP